MSPQEEVAVRDASRNDLGAVAAIYTHYVLRTTMTFNTQVRSPREWLDRFEAGIEPGPYHLKVAELDGVIAGYVETQRFRPKPAYDRSLELSVYVAPDAQGQGLGGALYSTLLGELELDEQFHRAYAIIALPNEGSVAFHKRWGFEHRGTLSEAGYKFDRYLDVAYFERAI